MSHALLPACLVFAVALVLVLVLSRTLRRSRSRSVIESTARTPLQTVRESGSGSRRQLKVDSAGRTDIGRKRSTNEDAFFESPEAQLYAVFDGMGGKAAGEVASGMACQTFKSAGGETPASPLPDAEAKALVLGAIAAANDRIWNDAQTKPALKGMGSTVVAVSISKQDVAHVASAGDSRLYHFRGGKLKQLTIDHDTAAELVRKGLLRPENARLSPFANHLYKHLGQSAVCQPDYFTVSLRAGDILLLASDGLNRVVSDDEIRQVLSSCGSAAEACKILVEKTLAGGAPDNVTVVVIRLD